MWTTVSLLQNIKQKRFPWKWKLNSRAWFKEKTLYNFKRWTALYDLEYYTLLRKEMDFSFPWQLEIRNGLWNMYLLSKWITQTEYRFLIFLKKK